jgi:hypothetical protein
MNKPVNTLNFVYTIMLRLAAAQIDTWLSGDWAEELWGECAPRLHYDIDLLYPASDFQRLDQWLPTQNDLQMIEGKRFSHKRAIECQQVMIEFVLLEPSSDAYVTNYFDGRYQLIWPVNCLESLFVDGLYISVASRQALHLHRQSYPHIADAYQFYLHD